MDRYPYDKYTILLGATRTLAHLGTQFTHRVFGLSVPLLPTYHGIENENPYTHIRDFEEVYTTFKEGMMDMDLLKLKAFPLTLKDKAKFWLNSLRPRTIRNWVELQA